MSRSHASLAVAIVALFVALAGTSYGLGSSISGRQLRDHSVPGDKLELHSVTGADIDFSKFPQVPSAKVSVDANHATTADSATSATVADSVSGTVSGSQVSGAVSSASSVEGQTFAQIDGSAGVLHAAPLLDGFGGLTLDCVGPAGTSGTVDLEIVNSSSAAAEFSAEVVEGSTAEFQGGAVPAAIGSSPTTTTFDFPVTTGAEVTFSFQTPSGTSAEVVTGTFGIQVDYGCSAFGNAEAS